MSMPLGRLQASFLGFLRNGESAIANAITPGGNIDIATRLGIYHHAYRARLVEVLQDVFERTWAYLGDEGFERAARSFIDAHPPAARTLQGFGALFAPWLATEFADDGEIAEIASIDWMTRWAFDGPDADALGLQDFSGLTPDDWARVGFYFHPTMQIAPIEFNAASLWEALEAGRAPPPPVHLDVPTWVLVWRKELRPHFTTINAIERASIVAFCEGTSFAATCAQLEVQFPGADVATQAGVALRKWIDDQLLIGIRYPSH